MEIKAIAQNSVIPIRKEASDTSEMISQLLFGELCSIVEKKDNWYLINPDFDQYMGWVDFKHLIELDELQYQTLNQEVHYLNKTSDLLLQDNLPFPITIGAELRNLQNGKLNYFKHQYLYDTLVENVKPNKEEAVNISYQFLNVPYLWGGKSSFGVDCSGLSQTVYKLIGIPLPRDAYMQAEKGEVLSFLEEAEAGDLAFFDNEEGHITHVGIMLKNQKIIHAHGKVRIDSLDNTGIFNSELQKHTHKLRFIKKLL